MKIALYLVGLIQGLFVAFIIWRHYKRKYETPVDYNIIEKALPILDMYQLCMLKQKQISMRGVEIPAKLIKETEACKRELFVLLRRYKQDIEDILNDKK